MPKVVMWYLFSCVMTAIPWRLPRNRVMNSWFVSLKKIPESCLSSSKLILEWKPFSNRRFVLRCLHGGTDCWTACSWWVQDPLVCPSIEYDRRSIRGTELLIVQLWVGSFVAAWLRQDFIVLVQGLTNYRRYVSPQYRLRLTVGSINLRKKHLLE